jgi:hypothetical protein
VHVEVNEMARKKRRMWLGLGAAIVTLGCLGFYGYTVMARSESPVDPSRLAVVERGDLGSG